jgi:hypothetical protein
MSVLLNHLITIFIGLSFGLFSFASTLIDSSTPNNQGFPQIDFVTKTSNNNEDPKSILRMARMLAKEGRVKESSQLVKEQIIKKLRIV